MLKCDVKQIRDECYDAHNNQLDCSLLAYNDDEKCVGYLDYSLFENKIYLNMVEVHKQCRRKGVASQLLNTIHGKYKDIEYSLATREGWEFLQSWRDRDK